MRWVFRGLIAILASLSATVLIFIAAAYLYTRYIVEYDYQMVGWPEAAEFEKPVEWKPDNPDRVRVLAIEGGALLGLADLEILKALEQRSGKRIHELFDFVAGTSTGAIIATMLLYPNQQTGEPLTAAEVEEAYEKLSGKILTAPVIHTILTGNGLFGPRMMNHARFMEAENTFRSGTFRDLLRPVLFPAFSNREGGLVMFRNWHDDQANIFLAPLVAAVTSAPTFFPAVELTGGVAEAGYFADAGLILNAPADMAYLFARSNVPKAKEIVVVALGTRWEVDITSYTSVRGGVLQWLNPLLGMIFHGESSVSTMALERRRLYDPGVDIASFKLTPVVPSTINGFDASAHDRDIIRDAGRETVERETKVIDEIVRLLTDPHAELPQQEADD